MVKVSVIVTVFNESKYLKKCLDSLQKQSFKDFEVICVDDASTDDSLEILEKYACNDKRFIIRKNKENIGLTKSRRKALTFASGEYIAILDADDFLSVDTLSEAITTIERNNADLVLLDLQMYYSADDIRPYSLREIPDGLDGPSAFKMCIEGKIHSIYIVKRSMYEIIPFDDSCRLYTDDNTARLHLFTASKICSCKGVYYYRRHNESETHKLGVNRFDFLTANYRLYIALKTMNASKDVMEVLEVHRWKNLVAHYHLFENNLSAFTSSESKEIRQVLKKCLGSIDFSLLPVKLKMRPPYWPTHNISVLGLYQNFYLMLRRVKRLFVQ